MPANNEGYYQRHLHSKISHDTDQTELVALRFGRARASAGIRDDVIADTIEENFSSSLTLDEESWQTREVSIDNATSQIITEIEKRKEILGEKYPFSIEGDVIQYEQSEDLLYEFLLCTSLSRNLSKGEYRHLPRRFERVSTELAADFFGSSTSFLHVGWPHVYKRFKPALLKVSQMSGELIWRPRHNLPDEGPRSGDEGVDFVLWKPFGCKRKIGQLFFLGQCACGNDWENKLNDISEKFFKWFEPINVDPVKIFTVPFVIPDSKLLEVSRQSGVILDRIRLVIAADKKNNFQPENWIENFYESMCLVAIE